MRKLVTGLAVLAALIWSAVVWGGFALLGWAGDLAAQGATGLPLPLDWLEVAAWTQFAAGQIGQGAAMVVWLIGLGLIAVALLVVNGALGLFGRPRDPERNPSPRLPASNWDRR